MAIYYAVADNPEAWHQDVGDEHYEYWYREVTRSWKISRYDLHNGNVESRRVPWNWETI